VVTRSDGQEWRGRRSGGRRTAKVRGVKRAQGRRRGGGGGREAEAEGNRVEKCGREGRTSDECSARESKKGKKERRGVRGAWGVWRRVSE
jgi:hypothetical protein